MADAQAEAKDAQAKGEADVQKVVQEVKVENEKAKVKVAAETKEKVKQTMKEAVKQKVGGAMDKYRQVLDKMKVAQSSLVQLVANQGKITEGAGEVKLAAEKVTEVPVAAAMQEQMQH